MNKGVWKWLLVMFLGTFLFSCAPTKKGAYIRRYEEVPGINDPDRVYLIDNKNPEKIQSGDQLYITVTTGDDKPNSFNQPTGQGVADLELLSYEVKNDGTIKLPYLNVIKLAGYSLNQASDTLESGLSQFLYLPVVKISFANSRITVLGEVRSPGVFTFNRKSVSIFQALASAGDIAPFGNRKNISIVRHDGDNIVKKQIDVTNAEFLTSEWYNIQRNDVIYVEPLGRKKWGTETFPWGLVFSLLSTTLVLYTFFTTQQ